MKRPHGRPSSYTQELADTIVERLAAGETLRQICRSDGYPPAPTVINWCASNPSFSERYARARREGLDVMADEALEIADDRSRDPNDRRVAVDARKWLLSKLRPDKYGDRVALAGDADNPIRTLSKIEVVLVDAVNGHDMKSNADVPLPGIAAGILPAGFTSADDEAS